MFRDTAITMTPSNTRGLQAFTRGDPKPPASGLYHIVATEGGANDWAAYMESIHSRELGNSTEDIRSYGNKISQVDAERLFPDWAGRLAWRP